MSDRTYRNGLAVAAGYGTEEASYGDVGRDDLPRSNEVRWVRRRKAQVVAAVRGGILTLSDALARYSLSLEEFIEWEREVGRELQERRRGGRLRELTKPRHGAGRRARRRRAAMHSLRRVFHTST